MTSFSVQEFRASLLRSADAPMRANAPLAVALGGVLCLGGFVLVGPLVSHGMADDAGILSFLFGESARRAPATWAAPAGAYRSRYDAGLGRHAVRRTQRTRTALRRPAHKHPSVVRKSTGIAVAFVTPPPRPAIGKTLPVTPLTDATLRPGDAVMTTKGIRVFRGARHYPFAAADFRPLAYAGKVAHRGALLAIDRAIRPASWSVSFTPASLPLSPLATMSYTPLRAETAIRVTAAPRRS